VAYLEVVSALRVSEVIISIAISNATSQQAVQWFLALFEFVFF